MSPAVSLDDVPEPEMRNLITQHMYMTEWERTAREAAGPTIQRPIPKYTVECMSDPVSTIISSLCTLVIFIFWDLKGSGKGNLELKG